MYTLYIAFVCSEKHGGKFFSPEAGNNTKLHSVIADATVL
jgi:hypothetical protein